MNILNGLSNDIYKLELKSEELKDIKVKELCFKIYSSCSVLVDREIEFSLLDKFGTLGYGPKVYETDLKIYRIEEYLQ